MTPTASTRGAWSASPNTAATCCATCAPSTGIAYDHREQGTLQLFRTQKQLDHVGDDTAVLDAFGVPLRGARPGRLRRAPSRRLAPVRDKFVGGLRLPGDETGDAHVFTQRLAAIATELGVRFRYGTAISRLLTEGDTVTGVETDRRRAHRRPLRGGARHLLAGAAVAARHRACRSTR